jgi:hypothetical protein
MMSLPTITLLTIANIGRNLPIEARRENREYKEIKETREIRETKARKERLVLKASADRKVHKVRKVHRARQAEHTMTPGSGMKFPDYPPLLAIRSTRLM